MEVRDVAEEHKMWTQTYATRTPTCPVGIKNRFGNNKRTNSSVWNIEPSIPLCGGYECLSPTFNDTSMKQEGTKRMFDNITKRK
jgi:hypothetical protein